MRRDLAAGRPVGFALDGPRGPARVVQPGAVWLAGATGQPLLPLHLEASHVWTMKSWDRTQVPKPFARVSVVLDAPLFVDDTSETALAEAGARLEGRLAATETRARELVG